MKRKTSPGRVITFLILLAGACTMILPFAWMLVTSLKEANLVYTIPPQWIPKPVDWKNYADVWSAANLVTGIKNSAIISLTVLALSTLTTSRMMTNMRHEKSRLRTRGSACARRFFKRDRSLFMRSAPPYTPDRARSRS